MDKLVQRLEEQQDDDDAPALWRVRAPSGNSSTNDGNINVEPMTFRTLFIWTAAVRDALRMTWRTTSPLRIGIALPPCSVEESALVLAVAREPRCLYVPVDTALPLAKQLRLLQHARVASVVTLPASPLAQFLTNHADTLLCAPPRIVHSPATTAAFKRVNVFELLVPPLPPIDHTTDTTIDMDDALYILFTSGSTGQPKGVVGTRTGALQRLEWMWTQFPFVSSDRVARITKLTFVDSVAEVLGALLQRVPLVHATDCDGPQSQSVVRSVVLDCSNAFLFAVQQLGVSRLTLVPSVLELLLRKLDSTAKAAQALASVQLVSVSGEVLPLPLAVRATTMLPHVRLLNLYGSTELSGDVLWFELCAPLAAVDVALWTQHGVPIGSVHNRIGDTQLLLANGTQCKQLQPLHSNSSSSDDSALETDGELLVAGRALALGYIAESLDDRRDASDDTAAKWVMLDSDSNSDATADSGRLWFRTGDWCRVLGDTIFFCGRRDALVKIRGQQVQLEALARSVETALAKLDPVLAVCTERAVALAVRDASAFELSSRSLVALLVQTADASTSANVSSSSSADESNAVPFSVEPYEHSAQLIEQLRATLGDAYALSAVECVAANALPQLASGKLDVRKLCTLYEQQHQRAVARSASLLPSSAALTDAQQFVLSQVARVCTKSNNDVFDPVAHCTFAALGGDSLHATLVCWEAQQRFCCRLQAHDLLGMTMTELVELLEDATRSAPSVVAADADRSRTTALPHCDVEVATANTPATDRAVKRRRRSNMDESLSPPSSSTSSTTDSQPLVTTWSSLARANRDSSGRCIIPTVALSTAHATPSLALAWRVDLGKCIDASPLVLQHTTPTTTSTYAVIGSHSALLVCVNVESGCVVWQRRLDNRIEAAATLSAHTSSVVVGTHSGAVYALDAASGIDRWVFRGARDAIKAAALVLDALALIVVGAYDHALYGLDTASGALRWRLDTAGGSVFATPAFESATSHLFFATTRGLVRCVALLAATDAGYDEERPPATCWDCKLPAPVFATPALCATLPLLLVGCADGALYALCTATGVVQWRVATLQPVFSSPCVYVRSDTKSEYALIGSHDGELRCVACASGRVEWATQLGSAIFAAPTVFDAVVAPPLPSVGPASSTLRALLGSAPTDADTLTHTNSSRLLGCVGTVDGALFVCDEATGAVVTSKHSVVTPDGGSSRPLSALFSSPVVVNGVCLVGSRSDELLAFRLT